MVEKKVIFHYDSSDNKILMTSKNNLAVTNDDKCEFMQPNLDILGYEGFILEAAKECLEEMLGLVNQRIAETRI